MKRSSFLLAGAALLAFAGTNASAACRDEIASLSPGTTTGPASGTSDAASADRIAKDGGRAPLQSGSAASPGGAGGSGPAATGSTGQGGAQGVAKDGSTMPLADNPGGGNRNVATSRQDAQSQQQGGRTAGQAQGAGGTSGGYHSPQMMAALDRARTMLQKGDEAGCMQAVQEAKRLRQ